VAEAMAAPRLLKPQPAIQHGVIGPSFVESFK
jgi:hypothetical protein